jgi:CDP-diacylglycerol--glycerol-3-phosphate 3-phosphatidyltransferase
MFKYIPLILTSIRIISGFFVPYFIVYSTYINNIYFNILLALSFILLSLTDFLDGFIARSYNIESNLGKILDPVADKVLVFSSLVTLVYIRRVYYYWVLLLIFREFLVMSLREIFLTSGSFLDVIYSAKIKTFVHLLFVIYNILDLSEFYNFFLLDFINYILLFLSIFFSFYSMFYYLLIFSKYFDYYR